jgi:hypothetical protein
MGFFKNKTLMLLSPVLALLLESAPLQAADAAARTVRIIGRRSVTVTTPQIRLAEIASVSSSRSSEDEVIIGLKELLHRESISKTSAARRDTLTEKLLGMAGG